MSVKHLLTMKKNTKCMCLHYINGIFSMYIFSFVRIWKCLWNSKLIYTIHTQCLTYYGLSNLRKLHLVYTMQQKMKNSAYVMECLFFRICIGIVFYEFHGYAFERSKSSICGVPCISFTYEISIWMSDVHVEIHIIYTWYFLYACTISISCTLYII